MPTAYLRNPFRTSATVTSGAGHHTPFGGSFAMDLDIGGRSRGTPVEWEISAIGDVVRGWVVGTAFACDSETLSDGGRAVHIKIQRSMGGGVWSDTGDSVWFVHLDPTNVTVNTAVYSGAIIGWLGPATAQSWPNGAGCCDDTDHSPSWDYADEEYHSSCACHSHVHVEGVGASTIVSGSVGDHDTIMTFPF